MTKGSHSWGAGSISKRLFPLVEDVMRHLENGTAAMIDYLIHDGRTTIELEELSTLIPQVWSINRKYVYALNSTKRNNVVYEAENLAYRLWKLRFPTLVHVALLFSENNQHKIMGYGHIIIIIIIIIIFFRINNYMYIVLIKHYAQNYNYIKTTQIKISQLSHNHINAVRNKIERKKVQITENILISYIGIQ